MTAYIYQDQCYLGLRDLDEFLRCSSSKNLCSMVQSTRQQNKQVMYTTISEVNSLI